MSPSASLAVARIERLTVRAREGARSMREANERLIAPDAPDLDFERAHSYRAGYADSLERTAQWLDEALAEIDRAELAIGAVSP